MAYRTKDWVIKKKFYLSSFIQQKLSMKKIYFPFVLLLATTSMGLGQKGVASKFANSITANDLKKHLTFLASDSLKGRDTGSPEQKVAAQYIAKHFDACGLKGIVGDTKSHFQSVALVKRGWGTYYLKSANKTYQYLEDFIASSNAPINNEESVELVFAGYGISDAKYDDFANANVQNKVVVVLEGEPKLDDGTFLLSGSTELSKWSKTDAWKEKMAAAKAKGAKALLMITKYSDEDFLNIVKQRQAMMKRYGSARMGFAEDGEPASASFAVINISNAMAFDLLQTSAQTLETYKKNVTQSKSPVALPLTAKAAMRIERTTVPVETANVLGFLEGTDKKAEIVVVTAHYDHVGVNEGKIYNGADDDGSGTVSVLEVAQAFGKAAKAGKKPRRSILFMTVTGEEKGLLGSEFYTRHPVLPLENTICDLNIDMVGRTDDAHQGKPDYVYVIGSDKLSSELHAIMEENNKQYTQLDLDYRYNDPNDPNRFYYRSDHYNFAKNKIPVAFFFNGVHDDYHQPTDDVEKIQFDKMEKRAKLVFYMAWELANRDKRIAVDSNKP